MVEINLLPQKERASTRPNVWSLVSWLWLPVTAAALLIPWILTDGKANRIQRDIDAVQGDIDALTPQKQEHDRLVTEKNTLEQVTTVAQTLRDQKTYWSNDLASFSRQLPKDSTVSLTKLSMSNMPANELSERQSQGIYVNKQIARKVDIEGKASGQQAVIDFLNTFEKSPNFGVNFKSMRQNEEAGDYTFTADVGMISTAAAPTAETASTTATTPSSTTPTAPAAPPTGGTQ